MVETKQEETQQEFFKEFSGEAKRVERFVSLQRTQKPILLNTSIEQVILAGIVLILAACLVFFLGVVRGRHLSASEPVKTLKVSPLVRTPQTAVLARAVPANPERLPMKPPPVSAAPQNLDKPYTIQLVTYKKKDLAEREMASLRRSGLSSMIIPSGDYYQVCAGRYSNKEEAKKDLQFFAAKYKGCYLRRG